MELGNLIKFLEKQDPDKVVPVGFSNPHSYRGYYERLAFEPTLNVKCSDMLAAAKEALGTTYHGYKGGEFTMDEDTDVYIAQYGRTGEELGLLTLRYMFQDFEPEQP